MPYIVSFNPCVDWHLGRELFNEVESHLAGLASKDFNFGAAEDVIFRACVAVRVLLGLPATNRQGEMTDGCAQAVGQWADAPTSLLEHARAQIDAFVALAKGGALTHRYGVSYLLGGASFYSMEGRERLPADPETRLRFTDAYTTHLHALHDATRGVFRAAYQAEIYLRNEPGWESELVLEEYEFEEGDDPTLVQRHLVREGFAETHEQARALFSQIMDGAGPVTDLQERARISLMEFELEMLVSHLGDMHDDYWDQYSPSPSSPSSSSPSAPAAAADPTTSQNLDLTAT